MFTRFRQDVSANLTLIAGLVMLPIGCACGASLDLAQANQSQHRVQSALDAAVLAANHALHSGATHLQTKVAVHQVLLAQLDEIDGLSCTSPTVTLHHQDGPVHAALACTKDTRVLHVFGHDGVSFELASASGLGVS